MGGQIITNPRAWRGTPRTFSNLRRVWTVKGRGKGSYFLPISSEDSSLRNADFRKENLTLWKYLRTKSYLKIICQRLFFKDHWIENRKFKKFSNCLIPKITSRDPSWRTLSRLVQRWCGVRGIGTPHSPDSLAFNLWTHFTPPKFFHPAPANRSTMWDAYGI